MKLQQTKQEGKPPRRAALPPSLHSFFLLYSQFLIFFSFYFWLQVPKSGRGSKGSKPVNKDRFISKMFLRGDSVILVLRNPK